MDNKTIRLEGMKFSEDVQIKAISENSAIIAFCIDRKYITTSNIHRFMDKELHYSSIYFLVGSDAGTEKIYVGQAKPRNEGGSVLERLVEHAKSTKETYRDIWNKAIVITDSRGHWGATELGVFENLMASEIPAENRLNSINPNAGVYDTSQYLERVRQIKEILASLRLKTFTEKVGEPVVEHRDNSRLTEDLMDGISNIPEFTTPAIVVENVIDELPDDLFDVGTVFLDLDCKGGEILRGLYERLMKSERLKVAFPNEIERTVHILSEQLYGVAISGLSYKRSVENLLNYRRNIKKATLYEMKLKRAKNKGFREELNKLFGEEFKDVHIDVVIGNPPYQKTTGGGRGKGGKSIYQLFIDAALEVADHICMVTKDNWMNNADMETTRKNMIETGLVSVKEYPKQRDVFKGVSVAVNIWLVKRGYTGETCFKVIQDGKVTSEYTANMRGLKIVPPNKECISIIEKLGDFHSYEYHVLASNPFGIETNFKGVSEEISGEYAIPVLYKNTSDGLATSYTDVVTRNENIIPLYKVICGKVLSNNSKKCISSIHKLIPGAVCSSTFGVIFTSQSPEETIAAEKYIKSRFFRYLVHCNVDSYCAVASYRFRLVPDQDFSENSDINWSASLEDIDEQLFNKYGLTTEERDHIKSVIKSYEE